MLLGNDGFCHVLVSLEEVKSFLDIVTSHHISITVISSLCILKRSSAGYYSYLHPFVVKNIHHTTFIQFNINPLQLPAHDRNK